MHYSLECACRHAAGNRARRRGAGDVRGKECGKNAGKSTERTRKERGNASRRVQPCSTAVGARRTEVFPYRPPPDRPGGRSPSPRPLGYGTDKLIARRERAANVPGTCRERRVPEEESPCPGNVPPRVAGRSHRCRPRGLITPPHLHVSPVFHCRSDPVAARGDHAPVPCPADRETGGRSPDPCSRCTNFTVASWPIRDPCWLVLIGRCCPAGVIRADLLRGSLSLLHRIPYNLRPK